MRRRLSYANVMSTIAVFGVLAGGAAYAASKIGPNDIKKNAVHSKHIRAGEVGSDELNRASVAGHFGGGYQFGVADNFGPMPGGISQGTRIPVSDNVDLDQPSATDVLTAPVHMRARDLRVEVLTASSVPRPVEVYLAEGEFHPAGVLENPTVILRCTIQVGNDACRARGPSRRIPSGHEVEMKINAPPSSEALPERDYTHTVRFVPG